METLVMTLHYVSASQIAAAITGNLFILQRHSLFIEKKTLNAP